MSIASLIGVRNGNYTLNNTNNQILQMASITGLTPKETLGRTFTYNLRGVMSDLRGLVGLTASDTTNFSYKETSVFIEQTTAWSHSYKIRGYIVFKTPRGYHTVNIRDFDVETGQTSWGVATEINRQMHLYANGYMPNGNYVEDYNCDNWLWVYVNLTLKYVEVEGE